MYYTNRAFLSGQSGSGTAPISLLVAAVTAWFAATMANADIIHGVVTDSSTQAGLYRVKVSTDTAHAVYTDSNGVFTLTTNGEASGVLGRGQDGRDVVWNPERRAFSLPGETWSGETGAVSPVSIRIWDASGAVRRREELIPSRDRTAYTLPAMEPGMHFIGFAWEGHERVFKVLQSGAGGPGAVLGLSGTQARGEALRKGAAGLAANTVSFQRAGYRRVNLDVTGSRDDVAVKMGFAPTDTTASLHPFFFAAEGVAAMSIVRDGKVTWTYTPDIKGGEISDASLLANGNVVFAWMLGATVVGPDKKVLWNYPAMGADQIHTCQPIGLDKVFIVSNGNPARARIIDTKTNAILMDKVIKTGGTSVHGQFRNCRMTKAGTMLLGHMDLSAAVGGLSPIEEYDTASMQVIWSSAAAKNPWSVTRLKNGNTLASAATAGAVYEISKAGAVVWQASNTAPFDIPGIKLANNQTAQRLENGNTLITNWQEPDNAPKIIEITPSRRVVWALNTKNNAPFAKTSTSMQLLDEPGAMEAFDLQR